MAHFAEIDENSIVTRVLVVPDEQEHRGQDFLVKDLGLGGTWIQTSYNDNIRKRFAGVGMTYDPTNDVFIELQPFSSWVLDEDFDWKAPVPYPEDGESYIWDEDSLSWILVESE